MMSSFLFGVAFERLLFRALNRYLLKNSSSMDTEIRSLILPLRRLMMLVLNIYRYTFHPMRDSIKSLPRKPAAVPGTPEIPVYSHGGFGHFT
jgi:hypothetical protein